MERLARGPGAPLSTYAGTGGSAQSAGAPQCPAFARAERSPLGSVVVPKESIMPDRTRRPSLDVPEDKPRTDFLPRSDGRPRSEVTGRHDAGSGANETIDGLNATDESLRHAAEDLPVDPRDKPREEIPVFDRGGRPPKA
jgi:hypothetical protein